MKFRLRSFAVRSAVAARIGFGQGKPRAFAWAKEAARPSVAVEDAPLRWRCTRCGFRFRSRQKVTCPRRVCGGATEALGEA